jgi:DNA-3-methyladenine glycosylase I
LDAGIIRNKLKVRSAVTNAIAFINQKEFGSFQITSGHLQMEHHNQHKTLIEVATSPLSDTISTDLKKRGFKFVGSTVVYAYLQATGLINDHVSDCWKKISKQRCCIQ